MRKGQEGEKMESMINPPIEEEVTTREGETTIQEEDHQNIHIQSKSILTKPGETPPKKSYSDQDH